MVLKQFCIRVNSSRMLQYMTITKYFWLLTHKIFLPQSTPTVIFGDSEGLLLLRWSLRARPSQDKRTRRPQEAPAGAACACPLTLARHMETSSILHRQQWVLWVGMNEIPGFGHELQRSDNDMCPLEHAGILSRVRTRQSSNSHAGLKDSHPQPPRSWAGEAREDGVGCSVWLGDSDSPRICQQNV